MEHIDAVHVNVERERGLSYPLREPVVCTQPKTAHYCLHQSCFGIPCQSMVHHGLANTPPPIPLNSTYIPVHESSAATNMHCHHGTHHHMADVACTCSGMHPRNCLPPHSSRSVIHQRRPEYPPYNGTCECHHPAHHPPIQPPAAHISQYHYPTSSRVSHPFDETHVQHATTSIHLATNNLTYPTPHYAMAFASSNEVRSTSWEPYFPRDQTSPFGASYRRTSSSSVSDDSRHIHHHHHHVATAADTATSSRPFVERYYPLRNNIQHSYSIPHHVRRYTSRLLSYPYPSVINYTAHHAPQYIFSTPILLPRRHFIQTGLDFFAGIDVEEGEWDEHSETSVKGLSKECIEKLPHYLVTKSTMEEFTDRERCVICICDFDVGEKLRILPCAHEFHMECVDKWLETNATCPICRTTVDIS